MQTTATFRAIASSSNGSIFFNPSLKFTVCNPNTIISPNSPILRSLQTISYGIQARASVVYARKKRRRNEFQRSAKLMLEFASLLASNLKLLPPPLDWVIAEFSGGDGNGGGAGLWRGFGGDGFGGWRRKRTKQSFFIGFLLVCGLVLFFLTELEIDEICGILGFGLFGAALIQLWQKRGITKDLGWGLSLFGILIVMGLRNFEVQKWVRKIRICIPKMKIARRKFRGKKVF